MELKSIFMLDPIPEEPELEPEAHARWELRKSYTAYRRRAFKVGEAKLKEIGGC